MENHARREHASMQGESVMHKSDASRIGRWPWVACAVLNAPAQSPSPPSLPGGLIVAQDTMGWSLQRLSQTYARKASRWEGHVQRSAAQCSAWRAPCPGDCSLIGWPSDAVMPDPTRGRLRRMRLYRRAEHGCSLFCRPLYEAMLQIVSMLKRRWNVKKGSSRNQHGWLQGSIELLYRP